MRNSDELRETSQPFPPLDLSDAPLDDEQQIPFRLRDADGRAPLALVDLGATAKLIQVRNKEIKELAEGIRFNAAHARAQGFAEDAELEESMADSIELAPDGAMFLASGTGRGMDAEIVARGLDKARNSGDSWMACCPAHDDKNPSLSIAQGDDRVLVKCHAGCSQDAVIDALKARGLWEERESRNHPHVRPAPAVKVTEHQYPYYRPADGTLWRTKAMKRDEAGKSVGSAWWIGDKPSDVQPLYLARELMERPDDPVLVVEGEHTCHVAAELLPGYVVTTSGGANSAAGTDWTPLKGRDVVVWPDNDSPGAKYAHDVAAAVGGAVRVVAVPPGLPDKWDLADPIPEGMDVERILNARAMLKSINLADMLLMPDPEIQWLVDGVIPAAGVSIIGGGKGVGKSVLARTLAAAVADGRPWLNLDTAPGRVLYIAHEDGFVTVKHHFEALEANHPENIEVVLEREPTLKGRLLGLRGNLEVFKPSLVIIDTMFRFIECADGNDYTQAQNAISPFQDLAMKLGICVLFTHHSRKSGGQHGEELMGSVGLQAAAATVLALRHENHRRIVYGFGRDGAKLEDTIVEQHDNGRVKAAGTKQALRDADVLREVIEFMTEIEGDVTKAQIRNGITRNNNAVTTALNRLVDDGDIERIGTGPQTRFRVRQ